MAKHPFGTPPRNPSFFPGKPFTFFSSLPPITAKTGEKGGESAYTVFVCEFLEKPQKKPRKKRQGCESVIAALWKQVREESLREAGTLLVMFQTHKWERNAFPNTNKHFTHIYIYIYIYIYICEREGRVCVRVCHVLLHSFGLCTVRSW